MIDLDDITAMEFETPQQSAENGADMLKTETSSAEVTDTPQQVSEIKVIGVGGGGNNAVNHMYRQGIFGVDFIVANTDAKALADSPVENKISLGRLGAGNNPAKGRAAALEHSDEIKEVLSQGTKMIFLTAGMGGGTGTGAAPVIAEIAKSIELKDSDTEKILVVAVVTTPFKFEGRRRCEQAMKGIEELRNNVDCMLVINDEKLHSNGKFPVTEAFDVANDVLLTVVKGIAEIITVSAYVNIDFQDVYAVMAGSGTALMGVGRASGEDRATVAIEKAANSSLLDDNDIKGAKDILLYFSTSSEAPLTMDELGDITDYVTNLTGSYETNVIWGMGTDDELGEDLKITLIATGFAAKEDGKVISIDQEQPKEKIFADAPAPGGKVIEFNPFAEQQPEKVPETVTWSSQHAAPKAVQQETGSDSMGMELIHNNRQEAIEQSQQPAHVEEKMEMVVVDTHKTQQYEVHQSQPQPTSTVVSAPHVEVSEVPAATKNERIQRMHDLLKNHPAGPDIVAGLSTEQLLDGVVPQDVNLLAAEAPNTIIGTDGLMHAAAALNDLPD